MKRAYKAPKAMLIDFTYDEQIVATSPGGDIGLVGDPNSVGLCQQMHSSLCLVFWLDGTTGTTCKQDPIPYSLRPII